MVALPAAAILLSLIAWGTGLSRGGFWADDFLNLTHFNRSFGNIFNPDITNGRYVTNAFFAIGTYAWGQASDLPFMLTDALVFYAGIAIWLRVGVTSARWSAVDAWWVAGLLAASSVWYSTTLDASAIGHSCGFLAIGMALFAHERAMAATTVRTGLWWSFACGMAWTFAQVSNVIYVGLLVIAAYCALQQGLRLTHLGGSPRRVSALVVFWNLVLPIVYFATVAYPATHAAGPYSATGLNYLWTNLQFYKLNLAPSDVLLAVWAALVFVALVGSLAAVRRRDIFPIVVLVSSAAMAVPALVQGQQRALYYLAMPFLLFFTALLLGLRALLTEVRVRRVRVRIAALTGLAAAVVLIFAQGADQRAYFVSTPYGWALTPFRAQLAELTTPGSLICADLNLVPALQQLFEAEMNGPDGFLVPPISAANVYLLTSPGQACPAGYTATVTVNIDPHLDFVASQTPAPTKPTKPTSSK